MAWTAKRTLTVVGLGAGVLVLYLLGAEKQNDGTGGGSTQCRVAVTGDNVNIRSAPVPDASAVTGEQASAGDEFDAEKTVQNGFRKLTNDRWLSIQYIRVLEGRDCG